MNKRNYFRTLQTFPKAMNFDDEIISIERFIKILQKE